MDKEIERKIKKFELVTGHKLVYLTKSGSKLYGTDDENSDTDLKGIFIPNKTSMLLQKVNNSYTDDSNVNNTKNSKNDIDFGLHSVHNFFNQLEKSETGAIDLLFSMWRKDTIVFENKNFTKIIKEHYKIFLNSSIKSFIGYALGQTKKYNIKGKRYHEVKKFHKELIKLNCDTDKQTFVIYDDIKKIIKVNDLKFIKFSWVNPPKNAKNQDKVEYVDVLGKTFHGNLKIKYFINRVQDQLKGFGNRSKNMKLGQIDYKSAYHSVRIAKEAKELLSNKFIKFPLPYANELKLIKSGKKDMNYVIDTVENTLEEIDILIDKSDLPTKVERQLLDDLLLIILHDCQNISID